MNQRCCATILIVAIRGLSQCIIYLFDLNIPQHRNSLVGFFGCLVFSKSTGNDET